MSLSCKLCGHCVSYLISCQVVGRSFVAVFVTFNVFFLKAGVQFVVCSAPLTAYILLLARERGEGAVFYPCIEFYKHECCRNHIYLLFQKGGRHAGRWFEDNVADKYPSLILLWTIHFLLVVFVIHTL